jgi:transcriptional regulator with XRE-family HTH domain
LSKSQKISKDAAQKLRKQGGAYLKRLRIAAKLTQRELSEETGFKYYTFISQIENGSGRIPPNLYAAYAKAVNINQADFVKDMLKFYDPYAFKALFGPAPKVKTGAKK